MSSAWEFFLAKTIAAIIADSVSNFLMRGFGRPMLDLMNMSSDSHISGDLALVLSQTSSVHHYPTLSLV
jgi:hypothetical protein